MPCACGYSRNYPVCDGTHGIVREVTIGIATQIVEEYKKCPDVVEDDVRLYCTNWKDHPVCKNTGDLLLKITKKKLYKFPEESQ
jgi:hypothetical protein